MTTDRVRRPAGVKARKAIVKAATRLASIDGINGLTIGRLASELNMSKSGLYAHFDSKLDLQLQTVDEAIRVFSREVMAPAMQTEPGIKRVSALADSYLSYVERKVFPGGCFFAGLIPEVDAQTGPIHAAILNMVRAWNQLLEDSVREAQELGEIRRDVEPADLAFQVMSALELGNYYFMLFDDSQQIDRARNVIKAAIDNARPR